MISTYLSASFSRRFELRDYAADLKRAGIAISSSWIYEILDAPESELSHAARGELAQRDCTDIEDSDLFIWFGIPPTGYDGHGGAFVELGYALALNIPVVVVAHRASIFCDLPGIVFASSWNAALVYVRGLHVGSDGRVMV